MKRAVLVCVLACMMLGQAYAWWAQPHMLVAAIAEKEISATTRQNVLKILASDSESLPGYDNFLASAIFPDSVKEQKLSTMSDWHYIDTPIVLANFTPVPNLEGEENVVWAGTELVSTLRATSMPWAASFALRYIMHLAGDIHQPLHASALVSKKFPNGDGGGNLFKVYHHFGPTNITQLHAFWDSCAGLYGGYITVPLSSEVMDDIRATAEEMINTIDISGYNLRTNWNRWAQESYDYAENMVYPGVTYGEVIPDNSSYITQSRAVCQLRVRLAGARLAYFLNNTNLARPVATAVSFAANAKASLCGESFVTSDVGQNGVTGYNVGVGCALFFSGAILAAVVMYLTSSRWTRRNDMLELK